MEINFKANLVNKTFVQKLNPSVKKYLPHEVSFVEINPMLKKDIKALKKIAQDWGAKSIFANKIYNIAKKDPNQKTYILTEQETYFENIDSSKVLGISQLSKDKYDQYCIEYLETKPEFQRENPSRNYKGIGTKILDCLKNNFKKHTLKVNYIFEKIEFYMNNGFDFDNDLFGNLIWKYSNKE